MVNDDQHDNYFLEPGGRFPAIEEDEPVNGYCAVSMEFCANNGER